MGTTNLTGTPAFLGSSAISYSAKDVRRFMTAAPIIASLGGEGIVESGDFAVAQRSAGANMSVDIASGEAYVKGDTSVDEASYYVRETTTLNATVTASDATNPRIDRVVLEIKNDSEDSSGLNLARIRTIDGTATAGATLTNLTGAAAVPNTCLLLANILVPALATTVITANIQDRRCGVPSPGRQMFSGYAEITADLPAASPGVGTGPSVTVNGNGIDPVMVIANARAMTTSGAVSTTVDVKLFDGSVAGTVIMDIIANSPGVNYAIPVGLFGRRVAAFSGAKTFTLGVVTASGTAGMQAGATYPAFVRAEWGS